MTTEIVFQKSLALQSDLDLSYVQFVFCIYAYDPLGINVLKCIKSVEIYSC